MSSLIGLVGGAHLLRAMGLPIEGVLQHLDQQHQQLHGLVDQFERLAMSPHALGSLLSSGGLPAPMFMPPPFMGGCPCPGHYAQPPHNMDLGAAPPGANFFQRLAARKQGARMERFLNKNPFAKAQFEMMLGGQIVPDGRNDGRLTVVPFPPGYFPAGGAHNAAAFSALGMLDNLGRAAAGVAGGINAAMGGGVGQAAMLGAMAGLMDGLMGGGYGYMPGANGRSGTYMPGSGATGGFGTTAGYAGGSPGMGGAGGAGGADEFSRLLADPSLTVEDKVTLMIMMIMKKMDKEIEEQANYINKIQQQQSKGGGQGGGGAGGAGGAQGGQGGGQGGQGGSSPSIDVETMKLKRLIDKRSQMFDMLRQIIDKYNETAKNIIQSIGR